MKKLLLLFVISCFYIVSFGQTNLDEIPSKIIVEYVSFDFNKFDDEISNLSKFENSLRKINSWYDKKQGMKGDIGASINDRLNRNKEEEDVMIKFALAIIKFDEDLTHSVLQGDGDDYQKKLNKLIEKTQKGKVTPELGQIIKITKTNISNRLSSLKYIDKTYRKRIKNKQSRADFNAIFNRTSESSTDFLKDYIVYETVEEDNPLYLEAMEKKKEAEALAASPHKKYSGKFGDGSAEYSYKETLDGERIFDGKYFYKETLGGDDYIITSEGQYKNDIRTGKWVWTYKNKGPIKSVHTQILNFDENGYLHGEATSSDSRPKGFSCRIYFNHGRIVGKYTDIWDGEGKGHINIEFNNDSKVVGTATFKRKDAPYMHYETYDENGDLTSTRVVNYETGDKAQGIWNIKDSFIRFVTRNMLTPRAIWLKEKNMSPQRRSPELKVYE